MLGFARRSQPRLDICVGWVGSRALHAVLFCEERRVASRPVQFILAKDTSRTFLFSGSGELMPPRNTLTRLEVANHHHGCRRQATRSRLDSGRGQQQRQQQQTRERRVSPQNEARAARVGRCVLEVSQVHARTPRHRALTRLTGALTSSHSRLRPSAPPPSQPTSAQLQNRKLGAVKRRACPALLCLHTACSQATRVTATFPEQHLLTRPRPSPAPLASAPHLQFSNSDKIGRVDPVLTYLHQPRRCSAPSRNVDLASPP